MDENMTYKDMRTVSFGRDYLESKFRISLDQRPNRSAQSEYEEWRCQSEGGGGEEKVKEQLGEAKVNGKKEG